jgi:hypothetical protein
VGLRRSTEEPLHTTAKLTRGVEIRRYRPRIAAETTITGSEETARRAGFRPLAGYIFGGNHEAAEISFTAPCAAPLSRARGEKIAVTAPVAQQAGANGDWVIRFFMPADKTIHSLPAPDDPTVNLVRVAAQTVAVRRFSGSRSPSAIASQTADLLRTFA